MVGKVSAEVESTFFWSGAAYQKKRTEIAHERVAKLERGETAEKSPRTG